MTLPGRSGRPLSLALLGLTVVAATTSAPGCYPDGGKGTLPPEQSIYFPVGAAVSRGGNVLYVANSDFDLQWNGGTLQSYDLFLLRDHTARLIANPRDPVVAAGFVDGPPPIPCGGGDLGTGPFLGETCAPPVNAAVYVRDSAIIGAFATDLQLSKCPADCGPTDEKACADGDVVCISRVDACKDAHAKCGADTDFQRIFVPVRGNASLTWADVTIDHPTDIPTEGFPPFTLNCGTPRVDNRCDAAHAAGNNPDEPGNTRRITMPGEPFGMAQSQDGTVIAIAHQTDTKTSLLTTGFGAGQGGGTVSPSLQFVVDGLPNGGNSLAAIPYDPDAFVPPSQRPPRPAFLETNRSVAQLDLLRFFSDEGATSGAPDGGAGSGTTFPSLRRPFLELESPIPFRTNAAGVDSRDIVIDPTPRMACKANIRTAGRTPEEIRADLVTCARTPSRVFVANRTPASVVAGTLGQVNFKDGTFNPDLFVASTNIPVGLGISRLYLAPIVNQDGMFELRLFAVSFDASRLFIIEPKTGDLENTIMVGTGPFAMAFDPFDLEAVARGDVVEKDPRYTGDGYDPNQGYTNDGTSSGPILRYRFAYIASFTNSFVQVIDLDNSRADKTTYQRIVFTLGKPTAPKGT